MVIIHWCCQEYYAEQRLERICCGEETEGRQPTRLSCAVIITIRLPFSSEGVVELSRGGGKSGMCARRRLRAQEFIFVLD